MDELAVAVQYGGIVVGAFSTALAAWHFRGKDALKRQLFGNTREILKLKGQQTSMNELFQQQLSSLETEMRDIRDSVKEDTAEIKESVRIISASVISMAEGQGELRGHIMATFKSKSK